MTTSIYTNNYRSNLTKFWQQYYPNWTIPEGYHVHHIKPKSTFSDPNDLRIHHPKNLIALHPDDHQSIHKCRGDKDISNGFLSIKNRKTSEETKKKLSKAHKGKKLSTEHKKNISIGLSNSNRDWKSPSKEHKNILSKRMKGKNIHHFNGYYIYNNKKFITLVEMSIYLKVDRKSLSKWCSKDNNKIITSHMCGCVPMLKKLSKNYQVVGKTYKELGFGFEPI